ncbi:MAG: recombinase family protein [Acidobacteriia bacterium]|nr:recombinase family protein [Terriglobia bacterium]
MSRAARNGRLSAVATATAPVRCAIYTRKSTDEGLDKDFNSLDAQREAAENYIAAQREEGWTATPDRYDDGGFSGGTTNRPALQRMLADVEAGKIDCVVVYKYDRLSRSMLDFLQVLDFFKRRGISFVSVSQRFDTSTPVGEMTLNILLSFAQFERQIIGERTRDKMRAARRRGRWTGGMPPLGFDTAPEGGKLVVNRDEAEQVKAIFELYVENPSLIAVAQELNRRGWRKKTWTTKDGKERRGKDWNRVNLRLLLTNPLYVGRQRLGDETFKGAHAAIAPKALFDKVQRLLAENRGNGGGSSRNRHGALLRGLLRCAACGTSMVHAPSKNNGKLYRYYRCMNAMRKGAAACPTKAVQADRVEQFVVDRIRCIGQDPALQRETFEAALAQVAAERRGLKAETKRSERDLAASRRDVERLVGALSRSTGAAADAVHAELVAAQERVGVLESRVAEVRGRETTLAAQQINETDLARALEAFTPIWDVLLTPEKERVLNLLIEKVSYDGESGKLDIAFKLAGIATLAAEVAS